MLQKQITLKWKEMHNGHILPLDIMLEHKPAQHIISNHMYA